MKDANLCVIDFGPRSGARMRTRCRSDGARGQRSAAVNKRSCLRSHRSSPKGRPACRQHLTWA